MRELALKNFWKNAEFSSMGEAQCVRDFGHLQTEYAAIRGTAAVCDFSFVKKFSFDESAGLDFLDTVLAANVLKLRYGRILNTFLADSNGEIRAEVFVADIDDKLFVIAETLDDAATDILKDGASCNDISQDYVLISVDGPQAWRVAKEIFGSDIFNLPYLSIEKYPYLDTNVYLMRNGKTGEFGYQFMAPVQVAQKLAEQILTATEAVNGTVCGFSAHETARLEGNFFNIYAEGARVKCPLRLGLQWMIDFNKDAFAGSQPIFARRSNGVDKAIAAVELKAPMNIGDKIYDGETCVGEIVAVSPLKSVNTALAIFDKKFAMSGFDFSASPNGGENIRTVSRPSILAESLVKGMEQE